MARLHVALLLLALAVGNVLAGPVSVRSYDGTRWRINDDDDPLHLERYGPGGGLDPAFGRSGRQALDFGGKDVDVTALRVEPSGRIWVAGTLLGGNPSGPIVQRLQASGLLDAGWAVGGRSTATPAGQRLSVVDMLPMPDGSVWLTGNLIGAQGENDAGLWRLKPDGGLDYGFGIGGLWRRPGPERTRAMSIAAGPNGSVAIGLEVLTGRAPGREIHEWTAGEKQLHPAPGDTANQDEDDDDEAFVLWMGRGWAWRPGPQVATLSGLPVLTASGTTLAAPSTAPSDAGHIGLNPFSQAEAASSSTTLPDAPVDELPWGWLLAGLAGLGAMFFFWRRGQKA